MYCLFVCLLLLSICALGTWHDSSWRKELLSELTMMRSQFWFELGQNLTPIYSLSFTSPQKPIERFLTISDGPGWLLRSWERSNDKGPNIGFLRTITPWTFRFWGFAVLWENCRGGWYPKENIQHCISLFFFIAWHCTCAIVCVQILRLDRLWENWR